jgi:imidazolonepropionase-like amidohydrolase
MATSTPPIRGAAGNLQGKTAIPGITDGHVHLWFGASAHVVVW